MEISILAFILGVSVTYILLKYSENKSYDSLKLKEKPYIDAIAQNTTKISELDKLIASNILSVGTCNLKVSGMEEKFSKLADLCEDTDSAVKNLSSYCVKLKESQMDLQEKLSNKRPVIKVNEPIPVQVIEEKKRGKGVQSLIKKAGIKK